jgi:predicted nucleic acid-binding protein
LLYPLLSLPGLKLAHRKTYLRALEIHAGYPVDFEDAMIVAHVERQGETNLYSYDRDFDQVSGIIRIEPEM